MVICFDKIHLVLHIFCSCVYRCICKAESYKVFSVFIYACKLVTDEYCLCVCVCVYLCSYFEVDNTNFNLCA